jgi:outer membrane lipoprotein SlyB
MTAKKLMILMMAAVFTIGIVGVSLSAEEVAGTVSQIEGASVTIMDDNGKQVTVEVKDPDTLAGLMPGDKVVVKDGKVKKQGG